MKERYVVRNNENYLIVRWDEMPPIAPHASYYVKIKATLEKSVHPTLAAATEWADKQLTPCPLLTPLPL